ncbi:uncharacterized protein LOC134438086 [Engraulis encrasicolus]|uniref:uncharacterized protein LOC134438086 n=1 Tax=Engraulis encrasicolus TaxID=184585 RepID=UPI002FCFB08B
MENFKRKSGSGTTCAVVGCTNSRKHLNEWLGRECFDHKPATKRECPCPPLFTFFRKPDADAESRAWLKAFNLKKPPRNVFVCSHHFVDKRPTEDNPYPELWLGYSRLTQPKRRRVTERTPVPPKKRRLQSDDAPETCQPACETEPATPKYRDAQTQWEDPSLIDHPYCSTSQSVKVDKATQCEDPTVTSTTVIDDSRSRLYTGVRMVQFFTMVTALLPFSKPSITLPVVDQILMTLMKLKLNLILGDISHRFSVSTSTASIVISHWICVMGEQFKVLIPWLPRETIRATMPLPFQRNYPRTTCIIDCAESAMQRATNQDSRSDTFSQYKSRNTVKYLVAVAPNGLIMFVSESCAGRSSDKFITMDSGFLDYLRAGDEVMADRGFTIRDLLNERKVSLNIPAFTHRRKQLTNEEITRTRRVANVRIHVERAIQRLKVFKILSQTVPISMACKLDNILIICAGLVNLRSPLIRMPNEV